MLDNKVTFLDEKGNVVNAEVEVSVYAKNHGICVEFLSGGETVKLTKNIEQNVINYGNYIDINTNPNILVALLQNEMGYFLPNVTSEKNGVKFPFFVFNREKLMQLDPQGLTRYEEMIEFDKVIPIDFKKQTVNTLPLDEINIFGKPAMLVSGDLDKSTVPEGFYVYDIRGAVSCEDKVPHLEVCVTEDKYASVIVSEKLDIPKQGYLPIEENDLSFEENGCATLKEFCEKHNIDALDNERVVKRGKAK